MLVYDVIADFSVSVKRFSGHYRHRRGKLRKKAPIAPFFALLLMSTFVSLTVQVAYSSPYTNISVVTAHDMITGGNYPKLTVLDVRTQSEYDAGHLYGATWIPVTELESRIAELAAYKFDEIIVYCSTGIRSATASSILDSNNLTKVYNLLGGIEAWESAGYPVWMATVHNIDTTFNYDTIQAAISAPQTLDGHTISVDAGTYHENIAINKTLALFGRNPNDTVVVGVALSPVWEPVISVHADNVTIANFTVTNGGHGIYLGGSRSVVTDCVAYGNGFGLTISSSDQNYLRRNYLLNNSYNLYVLGFFSLDDFIQDIDSSNFVDGKPVHYLVGKRDVSISPATFPDIGYLALVNSTDIQIADLSISKNGNGLLLAFSSNVAVDNVSAYSNYDGISMVCLNETTISNCDFSYNNLGVLSYFSNDVHFKGNTVSHNDEGIFLLGSNRNFITRNNFIENYRYYQTRIEQSHNCSWDDGYPGGGNYWSDYNGTDLHGGPYQNETGSDGIGDTSYRVDRNPQTPPELTAYDRYPLMGSFHSYNASQVDSGYIVDLISNSTISAFAVAVWIEHPENPNMRLIRFNVSGENGMAGFCRIRIPRALMNGTYTVSVNGTEIPYRLLPCSNETHNYLYFNYTHSTQEVTITPESPSFLILSLLITTTLLAVITWKRKHPGP